MFSRNKNTLRFRDSAVVHVHSSSPDHAVSITCNPCNANKNYLQWSHGIKKETISVRRPTTCEYVSFREEGEHMNNIEWIDVSRVYAFDHMTSNNSE